MDELADLGICELTAVEVVLVGGHGEVPGMLLCR
jgi:hypothetical protein